MGNIEEVFDPKRLSPEDQKMIEDCKETLKKKLKNFGDNSADYLIIQLAAFLSGFPNGEIYASPSERKKHGIDEHNLEIEQNKYKPSNMYRASKYRKTK